MFSPIIKTEDITLDFTGMYATPEVHIENYNQGGGHGGMSWARSDYTLVFKVGMGRTVNPKPIDMFGAVRIKMNKPDLLALRDELNMAFPGGPNV